MTYTGKWAPFFRRCFIITAPLFISLICAKVALAINILVLYIGYKYLANETFGIIMLVSGFASALIVGVVSYIKLYNYFKNKYIMPTEA
jgi:hypothetical protein